MARVLSSNLIKIKLLEFNTENTEKNPGGRVER